MARAQASVLAPFSYVSIIWATLFGYVVFGDFPGHVIGDHEAVGMAGE